MKFLRMRPGHGEQLIAEGDVEVAEDERAPHRGVPPPARPGHVGGGPDQRAGGRREATMVTPSTRSRATRTASSSSRAPPAARARREPRVTAALVATAIVVIALLWETSIPGSSAARRAGARRREARAAASPAYDPGRERRAEQRARELLRSCVNEEEWAMYRDLGFLRVWGGQAGGPEEPRGPRRRAVRLPRLPAQADRRLPAADRPAAQRVLRRVPGRDEALRLGAAAGLRRRAGQVDGAQGRRAAPDQLGQPAPPGPPGRPAQGPARPLAAAPVGARAPRAARATRAGAARPPSRRPDD